MRGFSSEESGVLGLGGYEVAPPFLSSQTFCCDHLGDHLHTETSLSFSSLHTWKGLPWSGGLCTFPDAAQCFPGVVVPLPAPSSAEFPV